MLSIRGQGLVKEPWAFHGRHRCVCVVMRVVMCVDICSGHVCGRIEVVCVVMCVVICASFITVQRLHVRKRVVDTQGAASNLKFVRWSCIYSVGSGGPGGAAGGPASNLKFVRLGRLM